MTDVTTAMCGRCEKVFPATHKPDACFACGYIDGPWVMLTTTIQMEGCALRSVPRAQLVGTWEPEARAQALVDLGSLVEGGA